MNNLEQIKIEYVGYSDIATNKNNKILSDIHWLIHKVEQQQKEIKELKEINIMLGTNNQIMNDKLEIYEYALKQIVEIGNNTYKTESEKIAEIALNET
jgi:hypothetical protein